MKQARALSLKYCLKYLYLSATIYILGANSPQYTRALYKQNHLPAVVGINNQILHPMSYSKFINVSNKGRKVYIRSFYGTERVEVHANIIIIKHGIHQKAIFFLIYAIPTGRFMFMKVT